MKPVQLEFVESGFNNDIYVRNEKIGVLIYNGVYSVVFGFAYRSPKTDKLVCQKFTSFSNAKASAQEAFDDFCQTLLEKYFD